MDTLRGIPEHIEADFGDSIIARDEAVAVLGSSPGLGPPDLCWLQKCPKRGLLGGGGEAQGYYHYVLGRDVSSSAAVAAYFALLNSKVEQRSMLQGLWMAPEFVIQRGFYCCYDAISRMDVRCELCVPGGVVVGCVDATGQLHDATPLMWMQAQVSAFIRTMLFDPEMRMNGGTVLYYDPCASPAAEAGLLAAILTLYSSGCLPGALQDVQEEQGCGVSAEHMDLVLVALWQHFRRRQRWEAAADFFRQLQPIYSPASLLLAAAERAQGLGYGAGGVLLSELLARTAASPNTQPGAPHTLVPATMVGLGLELLNQGESEAAASLARRALAAAPRCRPAWLLLAQCFIHDGQFAAALVALNVMPTPPLPAAEVELLHVVPPPAPKATTQPQCGLYDGELEAARSRTLEEASLDGSRLLAYLPGSILVNKEPLEAGYESDVCPNRITRTVLAAVYNLLQAIVAETGWDRFLEVRSRVFLMLHEAAQSPRPDVMHRADSTPHTQQQQQSPSAFAFDLSALQDAQQKALQQKLLQLGLHTDACDQQGSSPATTTASQPAASSSVTTTAVSPTATTTAAAGGSGGGMIDAAASPAAAGSGGGGGGPPVHPSSSLTASPPVSRGRPSSSSAAGVARSGSPKSYYASRLHVELNKPAALSSGGSAGGTAKQQQLTVRVPGEQQQQQPAVPLPLVEQQQQQQLSQQLPQLQQQQEPSHASSGAGLPPPQQQQSGHTPPAPDGGQRSMAGRVLLLGRTQVRRLSTGTAGGPSSRPPSSGSAAQVFGGGTSVGCGVPRGLAPNEVEDLSKYATASKVAPLRSPATGGSSGITPELWNTVFGSSSSSSRRASQDAAAAAAAAVAAAGTAAAAVQASPQGSGSSCNDDDDGLSAAAANLPRIRTRPLGEQVEDGDQAVAGAAAATAAAVSCSYSSSMASFLASHRLPHAHHSSSTTGTTGSSSSSKSKMQQSSRIGSWLQGRLPPRGSSSCSSSNSSGCSSVCSRHQQQQQPLGEGLDRSSSLLLRTTSSTTGAAGAAATAAAANSTALSPTAAVPSSARLAAAGSLASTGSGTLTTALSRKLSLAGEAASRSLEADREGLRKGWIHDDVSAEAGWSSLDALGSPVAGAGRRLCVRWLDELIVALWHDLQAHMEWKVVDQVLRETQGITAAELVLGTVPAGTAAAAASPTASSLTTPLSRTAGVSNGGAFEPPVLTSCDWMRRGALAERLGHVMDARSAYRAAVKLQFNLTAYLALLRLEASAGSISDTMQSASQVLAWHQQRAGQPGGPSSNSGSSSGSASAAGGTGAGLVVMGVPPGELSWALGELADATNIEDVRQGAEAVPRPERGMVVAVLNEWQRWQRVKVAVQKKSGGS